MIERNQARPISSAGETVADEDPPIVGPKAVQEQPQGVLEPSGFEGRTVELVQERAELTIGNRYSCGSETHGSPNWWPAETVAVTGIPSVCGVGRASPIAKIVQRKCDQPPGFANNRLKSRRTAVNTRRMAGAPSHRFCIM